MLAVDEADAQGNPRYLPGIRSFRIRLPGEVKEMAALTSATVCESMVELAWRQAP